MSEDKKGRDDLALHVNVDHAGKELTVVHNTADDEGGFDHSAVEGGRYVMPAIREVLVGTRLEIEELDAIELDLSDAEVGDPLARYLEPIVEHSSKAADQVYQAFMKGNKVLSLGGNHVRALDVTGALRACHEQGIKMGMVWVDAHPDLNTPDSTPSGHIHGMPSAVLQGRGPRELLDLLKGASHIDPKDFIYVGINAIDDPQHQDGRTDTELQYLQELRELGVRCFTMESMKEDRDQRGRVPDEVKEAVSELNDRIKKDGGKMWMEWDTDVVDKKDMPAAVMDNEDGMSGEQINDLFNYMGSHCDIDGVGVSELTPGKDIDGKGQKLVAEGVGRLFGVSNPNFSMHTGRSMQEMYGPLKKKKKKMNEWYAGIAGSALALFLGVLALSNSRTGSDKEPIPIEKNELADFLASFDRTDFVAIAGRLRLMVEQDNEEGINEAMRQLVRIYLEQKENAPSVEAKSRLAMKANAMFKNGFTGGTFTNEADSSTYYQEFLRRCQEHAEK